MKADIYAWEFDDRLTWTPKVDDMTFDMNRIRPIRNRHYGVLSKPDGGLWTSVDDGWQTWCESEDMPWLCGDTYGITLDGGCRVCWIDDTEKLDEMTGVYRRHDINSGFPFDVALQFTTLDFDKLSQDYDAIGVDVWNQTDAGDPCAKSLYSEMMGWDCPSLLILNPNEILEVTNMRTGEVVYQKAFGTKEEKKELLYGDLYEDGELVSPYGHDCEI